MKREELLSKFKELKQTKEELQNKTYKYIIDKPCMQLGRIQGMAMVSIKTAYGVIDEMTSISNKVIDELGIDMSLFSDELQKNFLTFDGHTRDEWMADLRTRVSEIQDIKKIHNINRALPLIEKWLSDDDLFTLDMEKIEELLNC